MIQRIQTVWLALASLAGLLTLKYSVYSGNQSDATQLTTWKELTAVNNLFILFLSVAISVMAGIAIFFYKNRKIQLRLSILGLLGSLVTLFLYYSETKKFTQGNYDLTALLAISIPVFLVLAIRGIYNDEKLIKNTDRLR